MYLQRAYPSVAVHTAIHIFVIVVTFVAAVTEVDIIFSIILALPRGFFFFFFLFSFSRYLSLLRSFYRVYMCTSVIVNTYMPTHIREGVASTASLILIISVFHLLS